MCPECAALKRAYHKERLQAFRERNPHYSAQNMAARREIAREIGFCLVCTKNRVRGRVVCKSCNGYAKARQAASPVTEEQTL
jgi:hypothetical protein